jgi:4-hydroxybenzoyl-CoA thioesterase
MIRYTRAVRFEDVDAAGIVFFAKYLNIAHEAMEHFFAGLDGGYAHLIVGRGIGFPAVQCEVKYHAPLRYGDVIWVDTTAAHVGNTSCVLVYRLRRAPDGDLAAEVRHTCVVCNLRHASTTGGTTGGTLQKVTIPDDVRAILTAHRDEG